MLPREKRLLNTRDFRRVYQKGSFLGSPSFALNYLASRSQNSRLGVVISKKVEPKAVKRNATKRKFREVARKLYPSIPSGYDVVVNIKKPALGLTSAEIEDEFKEVIGRIK